MHKFLLLALSAATLAGAALVAGPADARVVCKRICDDGYCERKCWEERGDRDRHWDEDRRGDRYRDRDGDRRHCVQVGPALVCD
jgi:hypothetical protein